MAMKFWRKPHTKRSAAKPFTLVFTFYSADNNDLSMPIAALSASIKAQFPDADIRLVPIFPMREDRLATVDGFLERLAPLQPDLVGISSTTPNWTHLDPFLRGLKSLFPQTPVIVGGYQAILAPEETIGHPAVDYACVGDGELPLAALVRRLQDQRDEPLAGLWEKKADGTVERHEPVLTSNLAALPFPDYGLFEREGQLRGLNLSNFGSTDFFVLPVMSGRGCLYQCSYCCNGSMLRRYRGKGKYLRKYAPDALVAELARLRERYGVQSFEFWDELFMFDMEFVWQFLALYQRDIGLPFSIMARVEKMDEKFCRLAADAGCRTLWFGIESGSQTYRQRYLNRNMTNDQILTAAENARKYGINRVSLNMVGMPFETRAHMLETLALNQTIAPEFFVFFIYLPLRDTPLYELAKENGLLVPNPAGDVLEGVRNETYRLNLHEHEGGITNRDFNEMCRRMKQFADDNNRL